jgi:uncharacterized membrane protein YcaP (DUF421 family)
MWHSLTTLDISVWEKVVRTVAVYLALAVLLRLAGKRDAAQLSSFDLVVMLLLSNVVQNAIIGPDNSLLGGIIGACVLIAFNAVFSRLGGWTPFGRIFEGTATRLVYQGELVTSALRREGIQPKELLSALRLHGVYDLSDVDEAAIQPSGALDIRLVNRAEPATRSDIDEVLSRLAQLEQSLA